MGLRSKLETSIKSLDQEHRIKLMGFIPEQDLVPYYESADLVVLPTQALEGFGLVMIEALAFGTPVLGTPVGAIPKILSPKDIAKTGERWLFWMSQERAYLHHFTNIPG